MPLCPTKTSLTFLIRCFQRLWSTREKAITIYVWNIYILYIKYVIMYRDIALCYKRVLLPCLCTIQHNIFKGLSKKFGCFIILSSSYAKVTLPLKWQALCTECQIAWLWENSREVSHIRQDLFTQASSPNKTTFTVIFLYFTKCWNKWYAIRDTTDDRGRKVYFLRTVLSLQ